MSLRFFYEIEGVWYGSHSRHIPKIRKMNEGVLGVCSKDCGRGLEGW